MDLHGSNFRVLRSKELHSILYRQYRHGMCATSSETLIDDKEVIDMFRKITILSAALAAPQFQISREELRCAVRGDGMG